MKLLICEGAGEIAFIAYLLGEMGKTLKVNKDKLYKIKDKNDFSENEIVENLYMLYLNGHSNLDSLCDNLLKDSNFKKLKKIGFFIDAEDSFENTKEKYKAKLELFREKLQEKEIELETALYISPNNCDNGKLEDLILDVLKNQNIKKHITDETIPKLEKIKGKQIRNKPKASLMIYAATLDSLEGKAHTFLSDIPEEINFKADKLNEIKKFIQDFIS